MFLASDCPNTPISYNTFLIEYVSSMCLQFKTNSERKKALYKSEPISDTRIKISKLIIKEKYKAEKVSDTKLKFEKAKLKAKYIINIINVYAPTSERVKKFF